MAETKQARYEAAEAENKALVAKFVALKQERVKARLDGTEFTLEGEITHLEHEIMVMSEVVAELADQARDESRRQQMLAQAEGLSGTLDQIAQAQARYYTAVTAAEASTAELVKHLVQAEGAIATLRQLMPRSDLTGGLELAALNTQNVAMRLSERLLRAMDPLGPGVYGRLVWAREQARAEDWGREERELLSRELDYGCRMIRQRIDQLNASAAE